MENLMPLVFLLSSGLTLFLGMAIGYRIGSGRGHVSHQTARLPRRRWGWRDRADTRVILSCAACPTPGSRTCQCPSFLRACSCRR